MSRRTLRSGATAFGLSIAVIAGATGCSWPDVSMSPGISGADGADAAPADSADRAADRPSAATEVAAVYEPVRAAGELDGGSVTHALAAGAQTVVIDYWTTQQATTWGPDDAKTVQLAAHVEGADVRTTVLVTRFALTTDDGTTRTLAAEDRGEFALMPPFSYSTAVTLPESAPTATSVTLYVQFDLLVETERNSRRYYRQTVLDTLELPLLGEDLQ